MKTSKITLWTSLIAITLMYLMADKLIPQPFEPFAFRASFRLYTGMIAMMAMSACLILAARPAFLESYLNGLDKSYRLHKWFGMTALVASMLHFWVAKVIKWGAEWGWYTRPPKIKTAPNSAIEQWFRSMSDLAQDLGEWTFYAVAVLMIVAILKWIPYHWFAKCHKWLAVGYLVLVFHSVVLMKYSFWAQPIAWFMALCMLLGSFAAIWILISKTGKTRQFSGSIEHITPIIDNDTTQLHIRVPQWQGHQAGQFVFVRFANDPEKPHPFTLSSAWDLGSQTVQICIKNLGDYTSTLAQRLRVGDEVRLEGAYGRFTFNTPVSESQIWVATGIGITPFLARIDELVKQGNQQTIDLFYSYRDNTPEFITQLQQTAQAANIRLHLRDTAQHGRWSATELVNHITNWQNTSLWYCGVNEFGQALRSAAMQQGLASNRFHQECFEMR